MTPNDDHLALLRKIEQANPAAYNALQEHGPGWEWYRLNDGSLLTDLLSVCPPVTEAWLPCDPTAIMEVASTLWYARFDTIPGDFALHWSPWRDEERPYVVGFTDKRLHFHGAWPDPHIAALSLLLKVCQEQQ